MKRTLHLLLLLGALIGLFGQATAYAAGPRGPIAPMAVSQMDGNCMEMMQKQQPTEKPCKGLTLDCIAAMGCVVPIVLRDAGTFSLTPQIFSLQAFWPATTVLVGSDLAPEPPPPTILG